MDVSQSALALLYEEIIGYAALKAQLAIMTEQDTMMYSIVPKLA